MGQKSLEVKCHHLSVELSTLEQKVQQNETNIAQISVENEAKSKAQLERSAGVQAVQDSSWARNKRELAEMRQNIAQRAPLQEWQQSLQDFDKVRKTVQKVLADQDRTRMQFEQGFSELSSAHQKALGDAERNLVAIEEKQQALKTQGVQQHTDVVSALQALINAQGSDSEEEDRGDAVADRSDAGTDRQKSVQQSQKSSLAQKLSPPLPPPHAQRSTTPETSAGNAHGLQQEVKEQ